MPFDINGNFARVHNWQQDRDNGIRIMADRHDQEDDNFSGGFNQTFLRTGIVPMEGNVQMNGNRVLGVASGTLLAPGLTFILDPTSGFTQPGMRQIGVVINTQQVATFVETGLRVNKDLQVDGGSTFTGPLTFNGSTTVNGALTVAPGAKFINNLLVESGDNSNGFVQVKNTVANWSMGMLGAVNWDRWSLYNQLTAQEAITVRQNNSVGLGVLDPLQRLHVGGNIRTSADSVQLGLLTGAGYGWGLMSGAINNTSGTLTLARTSNSLFGPGVSTFNAMVFGADSSVAMGAVNVSAPIANALSKVQVQGDLSFLSALQNTEVLFNSINALGYKGGPFTGHSGGILFDAVQGQFQFKTSSVVHASGAADNITPRTFMNRNGDIGVNTATPDIFGRGYGNSIGINGATSAGLNINAQAGYSSFIDMGINGVRTLAFGASVGASNIGTVTNTDLQLFTNNNTRFTIGAGGGATLRGPTAAAPASSVALYLSNPSDGGVAMRFSNSIAELATINVDVLGSGAGTDDGAMVFYTSINGVFGERLRLSGTAHSMQGQFTITAPNDVACMSANVNSVAYQPSIYCRNNSADDRGYAALHMLHAAGTCNAYFLVGAPNAGNPYVRSRAAVGTQSGHPLALMTSDGARMIIDAVGTIFMNSDTTSHVGSGRLRVANYGDGYAASTWAAADYTAWQFVRVGTQVGGISCTASGTTYNTLCDERVKENIIDADGDSGALIDAIRIRSFDFKNGGPHVDFGFIAQEVAEIYPYATTAPTEGDEMSLWGMDFGKPMALVLLELQRLRKRVLFLEGYGATPKEA